MIRKGFVVYSTLNIRRNPTRTQQKLPQPAARIQPADLRRECPGQKALSCLPRAWRLGLRFFQGQGIGVWDYRLSVFKDFGCLGFRVAHRASGGGVGVASCGVPVHRLEKLCQYSTSLSDAVLTCSMNRAQGRNMGAK